MQFVRLRLTGFKSFVDTTDLQILNGLTGVIGPNGCGKSNLLEALRWVMGETSAKSMRGAGMEDVIFAGAATRPARNHAEVALSIDNTERRAPAAFNDADEVEISRRITRDLGSTYKHNGKEIRARDAQTLFADAATGANSPALVRQGQIAELINAKPKARRRILEDAAGVAGLHARRHEALLRLNSAEGNLERVMEVLAQLEARETTLRREAERARKYRVLSDELRRAEAMLVFRRWREADREHSQSSEQMERTVSAAAEAGKATAEAARRRLELEEKLPTLREEDAISRAIHQKLTIERQNLEAKEREAFAAAERLEKQLRELEEDATREAAIDDDAVKMLEKLEAEFATLDGMEIDGEGAERAALAEEAAAAALAAAETALETSTAGAAKIGAERSGLERRAEEASRALDRLAAEAETADAQRSALAEEIEAAEAAAEDARMAVEAANEAIAAADERASEAETSREIAQSRVEDAAGGRAEISGRAAALKSEIAQLERLADTNHDGAAPLIDRVRVSAGAEPALGAALGEDLQSGEADEDNWGWVGLPPLENAPSLPSGVKPLSDYVVAPPALARRISQIGVAPRENGFDLQERLSPGQRIVSFDGDVWRWDGYSRSGDARPSAEALRLQQQNRLEEARKELSDAEATLAAIEKDLSKAREEASKAAADDQAARDERRRAEQELAAAARTASQAEASISALTAKLEAASTAIERFEAERANAVAERDDAQSALEALDDPVAAQQAADAAREQATTARSELIRLRTERETHEARITQRSERMDVLAAERQDWKQRLDAAGAQRSRVQERLHETAEQLEEAKLAPEAIAERRIELSTRLDEAEGRRTEAVDALAAAETGLREVGREEKEAEARLGEAREGRARLEAKAEAAKERATELRAQLQETAECEPEAFLETFEIDPELLPLVKDLERAVVKLRQDREKLGAVNLRADQELEEVSTERESLASEREELDAAIAKLRQGVNALNKEGRERMVAAFEEVNRNFQALFTHLFNGGDAQLVLVESDDPLEAGLEILCQPPGKRLASLSLLSGGEQTLTAISLIFAVFMVNPAPICVLDEVDAPLDDANVTRFCDLLDEMTRRTRTRFLIITHHAVTMSRMDRLFGVTMVEKGVSQLVSVDLETAVELVDA